MKFELVRSSHSVGEANYHIQLTPAYRRDIFANEVVRVLTRDYILMASKRHGISVAAIGFGPDHCHVFVVDCKNHSPSHVVKILKGFSSYMMRKNHWYLFRNKLWGNKFWSAGYFYRTVGAVNNVTINEYVKESQSKHWNVRGLETGMQRSLIEFAS